MRLVDLRSDTVTRPSAEMRAAMAAAEVGDDVYGEDPSVRELETRVADLMGKPHALFVPSGTMANQIAIMLQTRRGDEVVIGEGAHCQCFESGAAAALSGVQFSVAGSGGLFDASDLERAIKPDAYWLPRTSLVALENSHNRAGGRIFPQANVTAIARLAKQRGLALHLDGARLWNTSIASGRRLSDLASPFDTLSVCFSKGLGAPVGSALLLGPELIGGARRLRRMLGGAMRQSGILAKAALFALEHNLPRLAADHENARWLGSRLADVRGALVDPNSVETNIVNVRLESADEGAVVAALGEQGVLTSSIAARTIRLVTHLDVSESDVRWAGDLIARTIEEHSV